MDCDVHDWKRANEIALCFVIYLIKKNMKLIRKKKSFLITYVGGFSESDHSIHRWTKFKIIDVYDNEDINEKIMKLEETATNGAYKYFEIKNVSFLK